MSEFSFRNYFGGQNDFENLKKWLRINGDLYRELLVVTKERNLAYGILYFRCDLEFDYAMKLSKIGNRIIKAFQPSKGSICNLWTNTAHNMIGESEIHKRLGNQLQDEFYKSLHIASDQFIKFKKPVEIEIERCLKMLQEKREEEMRCKKKAFSAVKDCEKSYESIEDYKNSHPTSVPGNDKERSKIEKSTQKLKDLSVKAEKEYFEASLSAEESRHSWEQSYLNGLDQLQKFETDRLNNLKTAIESYEKYVNETPALYTSITSKIKSNIQKASVNEDLLENSMHHTNQSPTVYKTEQNLLTLYSESKENPMDLNRRIENLEKRVSALYQDQKIQEGLRQGAFKMLTVYEETSKFSDEAARKKTLREYSKTQALVNLLSANIYKLLLALHSWKSKPAPPDPLISLGMKIINVVDRNSMLVSILESKPGSTLSPCEPGSIIRSNSSNSEVYSRGISTLDEVDDFETDSEEELPVTKRPTSYPARPQSQISVTSQKKSFKRPLPPLPNPPVVFDNREKCKALHDFEARDQEELSFQEGKPKQKPSNNPTIMDISCFTQVNDSTISLLFDSPMNINSIAITSQYTSEIRLPCLPQDASPLIIPNAVVVSNMNETALPNNLPEYSRDNNILEPQKQVDVLQFDTAAKDNET